jgi:hypothetical protein
MAPAQPTQGDMSAYDLHPDTSIDKEVFVQASGLVTTPMETPRHIFICWSNQSQEWYQVIQLIKWGNWYHYVYPAVQEHLPANFSANQTWSLGIFTRDQREKLLELAEDIKFEKGSLTQGCRVWTAKLMLEMRRNGLISQDLLARIRREVPLPDV